MTSAIQMMISEDNFPQVFQFAEKNSLLAKNLYNAALFRIRQVFTGWDKVNRTEHEQSVFDEIKNTKASCRSFSYRRVLSYTALRNILVTNNNPDYYAGLPMQTAEAVVKRAVFNFQNWLKALKDWKKNPGKYTGKPCMPRYCKSAKKSFVVTNQDAVLYECKEENATGCRLKLPGLKIPGTTKYYRIPISYITHDDDLREIEFKPFYGKYLMIFVINRLQQPVGEDMPNMAGIDFGVDNIAALACTDMSSVVYKGGAILSENQVFAKRKAKAVSDLTKGHHRMHAKSKRLDALSLHHECFMKDQLHKISSSIIRFCIQHKVGTLVIGSNKYWKQDADMGKVNNQNFCSMPHYKLKQMLQYKADRAGIHVIEQEESYTSKADITAKDCMPVYGETKTKPVFSGKRIERGLYHCSKGYCINADCNGAANILRKAFLHAWDDVLDFRFLACPESINFKSLNKQEH